MPFSRRAAALIGVFVLLALPSADAQADEAGVERPRSSDPRAPGGEVTRQSRGEDPARAGAGERASQGPEACEPGAFGCFLDQRGRWISADDAYDALVPPPKRYVLRAAIEEVLFVGVGATWYFLDDSNKADWDKPSWRSRFTADVVRYDTNTFQMNFLWHPLSGAAYYGFPRANGLNLPAAAALGLGASLLWEYGLEFNEKISLNDLVTTPIAGIALGEFFSRLARYLNRAPGGGNRVQRAFGWTLGFSQAVHDAIDRVEPIEEDVARDALGYEASIAHRFEWRVGTSLARASGGGGFAVADVLLDGRLVAIPGYLRPGSFRGFFGDANVTRLDMRTSAGPEGFGFELDADTVLLGLHAQRVQRSNAGPRGFAVVAGSSVGYGYRRDAFDTYEDRVATARLPGIALDVDALFGRATLHAAARLSGDLAGVHAESFAEWREQNPDLRTKSILEREGYYYGWGFSESLEVALELPFFALEGAVAHARYASHEGLDRNQEELEFDVEASDRVVDLELLTRFRLARAFALFLELGASHRLRSSRVGDVVTERALDRVYVRLGQVF